MRAAEKALLLARLMRARPLEVIDRVWAFLTVRAERFVRSRPEWQPLGVEAAMRQLESALERPVVRHLEEPALEELEAEISRRALSCRNPFAPEHNADLALARLCYTLCRAAQPEVVVETGVACGVSTAFLLQAMELNRMGELHSVDLPPLAPDAERSVGSLVPLRLRPRWHLHLGASRRVLPALLQRLGPVGLFVHDSLHTYANIRFELEAVWPRLASRAIVLVDDAEANRAFEDWSRARARWWAAVRQLRKPGQLGVAVARP